MRTLQTLSHTVALLVFVAVPALCTTSDSILNSYFDAVRSGDLETSSRFWRQDDVSGADRLGLRTDERILKVDGDSPLWQFAMNHDLSWVIGEAIPVENGVLAGCLRREIVFHSGADRAAFHYYLVPADDSWLLASPVRLSAERSGKKAGRFIDVFDCRSGDAGPVRVADLDSCIAAMASRLGFDAEDLARLELGKLGYLLADPADVEMLAGAPTVGVANQQQDIVVTSHPCHAHELAHLLVNVWLGEAAPAVLPLFQEGVAVNLGGRWGRHPRVMAALGQTMLVDGFIGIDELLTWNDFHGAMADLTYPASGAMVGFLHATYGVKGMEAAYRSVSGSWSDVAGWTVDEVKARLAAALGVEWPDMLGAYEAYSAVTVSKGIVTGAGEWNPTRTQEMTVGDLTVEISGDSEMMDVLVQVTSRVGELRGALLIGGAQESSPNALFVDHFPDRIYHGESYGLLFSPDEAKLYDYRQQTLLGIHAEGFWPSDDFVQDEGRTLVFRVVDGLLPAGESPTWELVP